MRIESIRPVVRAYTRGLKTRPVIKEEPRVQRPPFKDEDDPRGKHVDVLV